MLRPKVVAALAAAGLMTAGMLAIRATPDAVLAGNYGAALADADTSWSSLPRNIWLSGLGGGSAGHDKVIAAGDTITISAKDGRPQVIEVTGLEIIDGDRIGVPGIRFQLVTGRIPGVAAASPVRFLFATDAQRPTPLPVPGDRVL